MKMSFALPVLMLALAASGVEAQSRVLRQEKERAREIPENMRPPAGMCRIWLDDVPAAQQPAPTDCASAVRNRPAKGRVIFGDDYAKKGKGPDSARGQPPIKGFAPPARKP